MQAGYILVEPEICQSLKPDFDGIEQYLRCKISTSALRVNEVTAKQRNE